MSGILMGSIGTVIWNPGDDEYFNIHAGKQLTLLDDSEFGAETYYVQIGHEHPRRISANNINWKTVKPPSWH